MGSKPYRNDLHGLKFNRLTVESFSHISKNNGAMWNCICDCGNTTTVSTSFIAKGYTKSCGCLQRENTSISSKKHGMLNAPIYNRWRSMKARCKDLDDPVYGGKGIGYDVRWELFENFYEDMLEGFSEELEIDRIDVTKGYCKENCRWVSHNENNYNKNKQSNNTSGKTGVNFREELNKFRAYITVEKKQIHLGVYDTFEEAVEARKEGELKYYGYYRP